MSTLKWGHCYRKSQIVSYNTFDCFEYASDVIETFHAVSVVATTAVSEYGI